MLALLHGGHDHDNGLPILVDGRGEALLWVIGQYIPLLLALAVILAVVYAVYKFVNRRS